MESVDYGRRFTGDLHKLNEERMTEEIAILAVGEPVFEIIRQKNAIYIDQTEYLPKHSATGKFIFCSRPSRFGKSLTVHTFDSFTQETKLFSSSLQS
jgi:hypothetical protein